MPRSTLPLVRSALVLANACVLIGCGWFMWLAWNAWMHSPPLHSAAQDRAWEIAGNCLSFAFPYLTGWMYSLAAIFTLLNFRPLLLSLPARWLHAWIILLYVASAVIVSWQQRGTSVWAHASWVTGAIPAVLSAVLPRWRKHTFQIVGFTSGMDLLTMLPYSSEMAIGFAAVWIGTALHFVRRCGERQRLPGRR